MERGLDYNNLHVILLKLHARLGTIDKHTANLDKNSKSLNSKMDRIDNNVRKIQNDMIKLQNEISKIKTDVSGMQREMNGIKEKNREFEKSIETVSDLYDKVKETTDQKCKEIDVTKKAIREEAKNNQETITNMKKGMMEMRKERELQQNQIEDLQWRSMKNNLVFTGLEEQRQEDTEEKLRRFLYEQLRIDWNIELGNVHRFQKHVPGKRRPIVARFIYNKDRQAVKDRARLLRGSIFGVSEQLPASMEDRRKDLLPVMREKRTMGHNVKLIRDKLIVDGRLYVPPEPEVHTAAPDTTGTRDNTQYSDAARVERNKRRRSSSSQTSVKDFHRSPSRAPPSSRPRFKAPREIGLSDVSSSETEYY